MWISQGKVLWASRAVCSKSLRQECGWSLGTARGVSMMTVQPTDAKVMEYHFVNVLGSRSL